ncbi:tRNA splicing endonuclease subunit sen2 [Recurvomyces mirabilis]|uniref:tRNA-intron lyase n=1 Tax=Recurvomyces mirabilis TaxID=574656 RepID=A0AAE1C646_9PEZI|nr:tRNA splicing endonuclease subunit sen2 [Recurvomyces mirabilis]KAK5161732.1 tRNA splicing endonuclease subunit sen2 [Recurvomyces mirabilis]
MHILTHEPIKIVRLLSPQPFAIPYITRALDSIDWTLETAMDSTMQDPNIANGHIEAKPDISTPVEPKVNGNATTQIPQEADQQKPKRSPRKPNKKNRNFTQLHAKPLPLEIYPLPAFNPSNPLSLLRLCYTYLSHLLLPPSSHPQCPYIGHFSPETRSIHVTNPAHVRALWEMGFFGKGSLSRSEPSWLEREKEIQRAKREGVKSGVRAAEEVTRARREERKLFKLERARVEREKVERQRAVEEGREVEVEEGDVVRSDGGKGGEKASAEHDGTGTLTPPASIHEAVDSEPLQTERASDAELLGSTTTHGDQTPLLDEFPGRAKDSTIPDRPPMVDAEQDDLQQIQNQEHLQLMLEEAFFLSYALGVLEITLPDQPSIPISKTRRSSLGLLDLFAKHSTFPSSNQAPGSPTGLNPTIAINSHPLHARAVSHNIATAPLVHDPTLTSLKVPFDASPLTTQPEPPLKVPAPDNKFLLNYVVYHHFRTLGWCVRPGVKFGCDYLLYNRGPVFSHAEFAVVIMPSYTAGYWSTPAGQMARRLKGEKDWWWLHCVNRVQSAVHKTLVLCYVDVPAPPKMDEVARGGGGGGDGAEDDVDVGCFLARYKIREFVVKRWLVNRSRD